MTIEYLREGISVIVEQGMNREELEAFDRIAQENNANFLAYRLEAPKKLLDERAAKRHTELGKPPIPKETLDELYEIHKNNDYPNVLTLNSQELTTEEMTQRILKDLAD